MSANVETMGGNDVGTLHVICPVYAWGVLNLFLPFFFQNEPQEY